MSRSSSDLATLVRERAQRMPDQLAFGFLGRNRAIQARLTCGELEARSRAVAALLQQHAAPGDRAVLCLPTGADFVTALVGCFLAGVVAVPAPPLSGRRSIPRVLGLLRDSDARLLLVPKPLTAGQGAAIGAMAERLAVIAMDAIESGLASLWRPTSPDADALAILQYTSGSTSSPRGVMLTHRQLLENERSIARHFGIDASQTIASWLPMHHDLGLIGTLLQPLFSGAGCYLMQPLTFLEAPLRWLEAISDLRATISGGPNFAFELATRAASAGTVERLDLSSWRVAFCGAEPVRPATLSRFAECFAPFGFDARALCPTFGLAEATLFVCGGRPGRPWRHLRVDHSALALNRIVVVDPQASGHDIASNGVPPPEHRIAIVDQATCMPVPPDTVGEIWVSGPSVAEGYWRLPAESERQFLAHLPGDDSARYLRTGDLGFLRDGELYICGRSSDLMIVRGRNIHPEDVERSAEECDPAVRPGGAAAFPIDADGEERAVLLAEVERGVPIQAYGALAARLRAAVVEGSDIDPRIVGLVAAGALPRTTSGKVRRKEASRLWRDGSIAVLYRLESEADGRSATATDSESASGPLAILGEILASRSDGLRLDTGLASLGLDSLKAIRLALEFERRLGVKVSASWLLAQRSIGDIAALVPAPCPPAAAPIRTPPASIGMVAPLNEAQHALWYLNSLGGRGAADVIAGAVDVTSPVDHTRLRSAFLTLLDRHPGLRMSYAQRDAGPHGTIAEVSDQAYLCTDLGRAGERELADRLALLAQAPIDLRKGPVAQLTLFLRDGAAPTLLFRLHHIAGDQHAVGLLLDELGMIYSGAALPPPHPQWETGGGAAFSYGPDDLDHWRSRVAPVPDGMALPSEGPAGAPGGTAGGEERFALSRAVTKRVGLMAASEGATLNATVLAALHVLAGSICATPRTVIGMPTANRSRPGTESAISCLANILPLTADLDVGMTFRELVARVKADVLAALDRQSVPFAQIAAMTGSSREAEHPLLRLVFAWYGQTDAASAGMTALALNLPGVRWDLGGLGLVTRAVPGRDAQYPLAILAAQIAGRLEFTLRYRKARFTASAVRTIGRRLRRILAQVASRPEITISDLDLLLPDEERRIETWNATAVASPEQRIDQSILRQALETPDAVAARFRTASMSYGQLAGTAGHVAARLHQRGVEPGEVVAVLTERSLELPALLVGILLAGCAFMPLDPDEPMLRRNGKLERSGAALLINASSTAAEAAPVETIGMASLLAGALVPYHTIAGGEPDSPCYVLHTSGSTGQPKGVIVPHSGIANRLAWMQRYAPIGPGDVVLQKTPVTFDVSVWEFFWPLMTGAALVLAEPGGHRDPFHLLDLIDRENVTVLHFVPSMLRPALDALRGRAALHSLRHVFCSGEALSADIAARARAELGCPVSNLYGPTEASIDVTAWRCTELDETEVPIGRPIDNTIIEILDAAGRRAPIGTVGQLAIGGAGLAWGYIARPGLTAQSFVPDPWRTGARLYLTGDLASYRPDGSILFRGRVDDQIKVRGIRVEPGEIEAVMRAHPAVADAGVVAVRGIAGDVRLLAYAVAREGSTVPDLRAYLETHLPAELRPETVTAIDRLPLTASGKLDRRALIALSPGPEVPAGPSELTTPTEVRIAEIWRTLLGDRPIGPGSDFFRLGGHSLLLAQLQVRIYESFAVRIPLARLLSLSSLSALARSIDVLGPTPRSEPRPAPRASPTGPFALSYAQSQIFMLEQISSAPDLFNIPVSIHLPHAPPEGVVRTALQLLSYRHEALRTRFLIRDGRPEQVIDAQITVPFEFIKDAGTDVMDLAALPSLRSAAECPGNPPMLVRQFQLPDGAALIRFDLHHLIADAEAAGIMLLEFCAVGTSLLRGQTPSLPPLAAGIADVVVEEARQLTDGAWSQDEAYWLSELAAGPLPTTLPTDFQTTARGTIGQAVRLRHHLPTAVSTGLLARAAAHRTTLYAELLAAYAILHHRLSGEEELVIGMPTSARPGSAFEGVLGCFVNVLPLRLTIGSDDPGIDATIGAVSDRIISALEHRRYPMALLLEKRDSVRVGGSRPLYRVVFQLIERPPEFSIDNTPCALIVPLVDGPSKSDLIWTIRHEIDGRLTIELSYDTGLYAAGTAARLLAQFSALACGLAEGIVGSIYDLDLDSCRRPDSH